jgi:hypothetical protein
VSDVGYELPAARDCMVHCGEVYERYGRFPSGPCPMCLKAGLPDEARDRANRMFNSKWGLRSRGFTPSYPWHRR